MTIEGVLKSCLVVVYGLRTLGQIEGLLVFSLGALLQEKKGGNPEEDLELVFIIEEGQHLGSIGGRDRRTEFCRKGEDRSSCCCHRFCRPSPDVECSHRWSLRLSRRKQRNPVQGFWLQNPTRTERKKLGSLGQVC